MKGAAERTTTLMRAIFASRGLTLHQVSVQSELLYGSGSPSRIPHTLYHSIERSPRFGPSLPQACALSHMTSHRLEDWLAVLGIDLDQVAGLEASLPLPRTRLIDPAFRQIEFAVSGAAEEQTALRPGEAVPLARFPQHGRPIVHTCCKRREPRFLFARIGAEDGFAYPELLPGSIVRVTPWIAPKRDSGQTNPAPLMLIEHERGLWCGRFHLSGDDILHAAALELSHAPITFRVPREARILGAVDMEIRWIHRFEHPHVPAELATYQQPRDLGRRDPGLGSLIRGARARAGLTLGQASRLSHRISARLRDEQYAMAESTLSEYEATDLPPRHIEKVIAVCLIYGIPLMDFVAASGFPAEMLGREAIPAHLCPEFNSAVADRCRQDLAGSDHPGIGAPLLPWRGELPWFLRSALADLSGIQRPSVRDFFLLSDDQPFLPPYTLGSCLALVNRRKKTPIRLPDLPRWQQPAYVLLLRNGEYRCACCSLDRRNLVLFPEREARRAPEQLRLGQDVEVIGQIVALVRSIR